MIVYRIKDEKEFNNVNILNGGGEKKVKVRVMLLV